MIPLLLLACTTGDPEPPPKPSTPTAPSPAEPDPEPEADATLLSSLAGRKVWMVNAPSEACAQATALGLEVECDAEREGAVREEVVAWCPDIDPAALAALQRALGVSAFALRTWQSQPSEADPTECGSFAEITIRY